MRTRNTDILRQIKTALALNLRLYAAGFILPAP
jgi:hypothetical protein